MDQVTLGLHGAADGLCAHLGVLTSTQRDAQLIIRVVNTSELEVVWPLHRSHYLSPALADAGIDMETEPESSEGTTSTSVVAATRGRELAVRARNQLDTLTRQQQRILHRSALIDYVIAAETRAGQSLTLGDALAELLADITEAAGIIGMILQQVGDR